MDNTTLLVIIVVIILIILIILFATPACKEAVSKALTKKVAKDMKVKSEKVAASRKASSTKKSPVKAAKPTTQPKRKVNNPKVEEMRAKALAAQKDQKKVGAQRAQPKVEKPKYKTASDLKVPEKIPVLNGSVENLFNAKSDIEAEFGITESELDQMAREYKQRHLSNKKPHVARNKALRRREVEAAERKVRESMKGMAVQNQRFDTEELTQDIMRKNVMRTAQNQKPKYRQGRRFVPPRN